MVVKQNGDFLFLFEAAMTNPNGDPDQENKPRMDYETSTCLVSDARRKRDSRDFLKEKGYRIFVDTLGEKKVPMDKMFIAIRDEWLQDERKMEELFMENAVLKEKWEAFAGKDEASYYEAYQKGSADKKRKAELTEFNNLFLTQIIKRSLIDIRLFGSAMAVEGVSRTFTGPVQVTWGYSLHPVELVKSNTITSIMNDDNSTFGKKHKLHYGLIAHYGTVNKYSAQLTGMNEEDRQLFRQSLVQGMMNNQTDSKQGQTPLLYLEVVYTPEFDGYLGDLRRFLQVEYDENKAIRKLDDVHVDFGKLSSVIAEMKEKGYVDKVIAWIHPFVDKAAFSNLPSFETIDLWVSIPVCLEA